MTPALQAILMGAALSAGITGIYVAERRSNKQPASTLASLTGLFLILWIVFSSLRYLSILLEPYLKPLEAWFDRYPVYVIIGGLALSFVLFSLRRRRKDLYGYLEIIIGFTVLTFFAINPYPGIIAFIVGFATPVYIIIRGAVNIDEYQPRGDQA